MPEPVMAAVEDGGRGRAVSEYHTPMTRPLEPEPEPPGLPSLPAAPEEEVEEVAEEGRPQSSSEGRAPLGRLPSRKVSGLTSVQLLRLCWIPLLVSLAPMVTIIMLYMKFDDVLPDDTMARSFNEDNMPTGFTSPLKYTMKMLSLCIMLQAIFTFCGVMLNPRANACAYKFYNLIPSMMAEDLDFILAPDNIVETVKFVCSAFIWLGTLSNVFIVSIVWTLFIVNEDAVEKGVETDPEVWRHLDTPDSACCVKTYAPIYFCSLFVLFAIVLLYRLHSFQHYGARGA